MKSEVKMQQLLKRQAGGDHKGTVRVIEALGETILDDDDKNIRGVCYCHCKDKGATEHGWSMHGGPYK